MRLTVVVAAAVLVASFACVVFVSCGSNCKPGTLLLHVGLLDNAPLADTIAVDGDDPGAAVADRIPHTPNPAIVALGSAEHIVVVVTWQQGYPKDATVNLTVRALGGGVVLGINTTTIRLGDICTESEIPLSDRGYMPDDGGAGD